MKGGKKSIIFFLFFIWLFEFEHRAARILALIKGKRNAAFPVKMTILIVADSR